MFLHINVLFMCVYVLNLCYKTVPNPPYESSIRADDTVQS